MMEEDEFLQMKLQKERSWQQTMAERMVEDMEERGATRDEAIERAMHTSIVGDVWVVCRA